MPREAASPSHARELFLNYRFKSCRGTEQKDLAARCLSSGRRFPFRSRYTGWSSVPPLPHSSCQPRVGERGLGATALTVAGPSHRCPHQRRLIFTPSGAKSSRVVDPSRTHPYCCVRLAPSASLIKTSPSRQVFHDVRF